MKLALGTAQFGLDYGIANQHGKISDPEGRAILARARAAGMDTLDTAIAYGDSEARLGQLGVSEWRIVTKLPPIPSSCPSIADWVATQVDESLRRLGVSKLHGLLLHRPAQLLEKRGRELYAAMLEAVGDGRVSKIGISIYGPSELQPILDGYSIGIVQTPLNIVDRRIVETGWLTRLASMGVEVHTRSALLQGLLAMSANQRPSKFARWSTLWSGYDNWLAESRLTALQACLRFVLGHREVNRVVIGVDSVSQLDAAIQAGDGSVTAPAQLMSADEMLVNPARWAELSN